MILFDWINDSVSEQRYTDCLLLFDDCGVPWNVFSLFFKYFPGTAKGEENSKFW